MLLVALKISLHIKTSVLTNVLKIQFKLATFVGVVQKIVRNAKVIQNVKSVTMVGYFISMEPIDNLVFVYIKSQIVIITTTIENGGHVIKDAQNVSAAMKINVYHVNKDNI